jgi:hypothetical protein
VLASFFLPEQVKEAETLVVRLLHRVYNPTLRFALAHRAVMVGAGIFFLAASAFLASRLGSEFLPHLEEGNFWIRASMPMTLSLEDGESATRKMRLILLHHPEVVTVISQHGRPDNGSDASPFSNVELFVPLKPYDEWPNGLTKEKLTGKIQAEFQSELPGVNFNFSQYIQDNIEEAISGVKGANSGALYFNLYTPQVNVSYAPDVFGLNRRTMESLKAQAEESRFALAATHITLSANVALAAIQEASLRAQIAATQQLVAQRPDVRQAEEILHSASAQIGIAVANRLPNLTLSADAGNMALAASQLFAGGAGFWTLAGGVTQPIFQGGALLHNERAARAAYVEAAEQYRGAVLTAFQNVADTLIALEQDGDALSAAVTAKAAALTTLDLARRQWQSGYAGYLGLLSAEQIDQQAVINLVQAQANRYADTAALFQALGGGWWNRADLVRN